MSYRICVYFVVCKQSLNSDFISQLTTRAVPTSSDVPTAGVYSKRGNAIMKTTAKMDPTRLDAFIRLARMENSPVRISVAFLCLK